MNIRVVILSLLIIGLSWVTLNYRAEQAISQQVVYHFPGCQVHNEDFQPARSSLPTDDAILVKNFFNSLDDVSEITDVALRSFFKKENIEDAYKQYSKRMDELLPILRAYRFPKEMENAGELILSAIEEQRAFFNKWHEALQKDIPFTDSPLGHELARSSSSKLHQAYAKLYLTYTNEHKCNLEAFSSHLCTLDLL